MIIPHIVQNARDAGSRPRVHPNGFIQLDLNESERLHVWHPRLPYRQRTYHPMHDHVFGFESTCLVGRLTHIPYSVVPDYEEGDHMLWQAVVVGPKETVLEPVEDAEPVRLVPDLNNVRVVQPTESYTFQPFFFHESMALVPTATVIVKNGPTLQQGAGQLPRIAVPIGVHPDNGFCRHAVDADILWDLIMRTMSQCRTSL